MPTFPAKIDSLVIRLAAPIVGAIALTLGACDAPEEHAAGAVTDRDCPTWRCGFNAAEVNGRSIRELNLDGAANSAGMKITGFVAPLGLLGNYQLAVEGDELVATKPGSTLRGLGLVGATILVKEPGLLSLPIPITIAGYSEIPSWADDAPPVPTYALIYPDLGSLLGSRNVCVGDLSELLATSATVLGGETYDLTSKQVNAGMTRWFTLACAGSAAAKLRYALFAARLHDTNVPTRLLIGILPLTLAAEHTSTLEVGTSIAVAFARNPMTVAQTAWDLQAYSRGRFLLGLGTQIQPHIEKRFGMPWSHPVRRMAEFVAALREIWRCWRTGDRLRFAGDFYNHTLMTPMFTPAPSGQPDPTIFIAAVGEAMTQACGEAADGLLAHAFTTRRYLDEVTIPALQRGLDRAGRQRTQFQVSGPVFVVTGRDEGEMTAAAAAYRKQIAFYASTPAYRKVLELHGWGELQTDLHRLSLGGRWDAMADLIDDEILETFAVVAPVDRLAAALTRRCDGIIDRVMVGLPAGTPEATVRAFLDEVRSGG